MLLLGLYYINNILVHNSIIMLLLLFETNNLKMYFIITLVVWPEKAFRSTSELRLVYICCYKSSALIVMMNDVV